jgi:hypothetical protein
MAQTTRLASFGPVLLVVAFPASAASAAGPAAAPAVVVVMWQAGDVERWPKHVVSTRLGPFFIVPGFFIPLNTR